MRTAFIDLVRAAIRRELNTTPGRINLIGVLLLGALIPLSVIGDVVQVCVRIIQRSYTTGLPSPLPFFAILALVFVACVVMLALYPDDRSTEHIAAREQQDDRRLFMEPDP